MKPASQIAAGVFFALSKKMKVGIKLKAGIKMIPGFSDLIFPARAGRIRDFRDFFRAYRDLKSLDFTWSEISSRLREAENAPHVRPRRRGWLETVTDRRPSHPQGRGLEAQEEQSSRGRETRARASCKSSRRGGRLS